MSFAESVGGVLVGVVVGGVVTYAGQRSLELRRDRRQEAREASGDRAATRLAARLVLVELLTIVSWLKAYKATGQWWTRPRLPDDAWVEHGAQLSRVLGDDEWRKVAPVFNGAAQWNSVSAVARRVWQTRETIPLRFFSEIAKFRDTLLESAETAIQTLQEVALPTVDDPTEFSKIVTAPVTSTNMSLKERVLFAGSDPLVQILAVGILWFGLRRPQRS